MIPIDSIQLIEIAVGVAKKIYEQVQLVKTNKEQFNRIYHRIEIVTKALQGLEQIADVRQFNEGLTALNELLNKIYDFAASFSQKKYLIRLLRAGNHKETFIDFNDQLESHMNVLNLGLNAQQIMNREQDKQDQEKDHQALLANQHKLILLQQQELEQLQGLRLDEAMRHEVIQQQLESLRFLFANLFMPGSSSPKLPIDRHFLIPLCDLEIEREITRGSFGVVFEGRWSDQLVAIKQLKKMGDAEHAQFVREVQIMSRLRSPYITQFFGACLEPTREALVMEYMSQGSLDIILRQRQLPKGLREAIILDIARGLQYLHAQKVIHRDLKCANVLLDAKGNANLTDFGLSKIATRSVLSIDEASEAYEYKAPELLDGKQYSEASDIYSLGILIWEIYVGRKPYQGIGKQGIELLKAVASGFREKIPDEMPDAIQKLVASCWAQDPNERPTITNIVEILQTSIRPVSPSAEQLCKAGLAADKEQDDVKAFDSYRRASEKGYYRANTYAAFFYLTGRGGAPKDKEKARELLEVGAQAGHPRAQYNLAKIYEKGDGVTQDTHLALYWYRQGAAQKDAPSQTESLRLETTRPSKSAGVA